VGTQAVFNVMMGKYKVMTGEFSDLMLGYYGETDAEKNPDVVTTAKEFGKKEAITCRPADLIAPEWDKLVSEATALPGCDGTDEDVLTYAMFPQVAPKFFSTRKDGPLNLGKDPSLAAGALDPSHPGFLNQPIEYDIKVNGKTKRVVVAPVGGNA
jgi:methylmalonyl-CoA carboxyltransferase 5S subunit